MEMQRQQVGKIAAKSQDFLTYCHKAFDKMKLELKMSDNEIESLYQDYSQQYGQKLNAFYQLRSLFSSVIEGLIVLDRVVFLLEQVNVHILLSIHYD